MEKGYYIPEIKEFYVGFECEIQSSYGWQKGIWPDVLQGDSLTYQTFIDEGVLVATRNATVRVKYLNKADIESFGFKSSIDDGVVCYNKEYYNIYWFGDVVISIDKVYNSNRISLFKGSIKNKSELIVILKQIGIIEE